MIKRLLKVILGGKQDETPGLREQAEPASRSSHGPGLSGEVRSYITREVDGGFAERDEIVTATIEFFDGDEDNPDLSEPEIVRAVDEALAAHTAEEADALIHSLTEAARGAVRYWKEEA